MNIDPKMLAVIKKEIKVVKDFPIKGIAFKDITPLFLKPQLIHAIIDELALFAKKVEAEVIVGPESRGFLFGLPTALKLNLPFVLARKPGKLPRETVNESYKLEYGGSTFHIHTDAIQPKQKILIIDDVLATGGTTKCIETLIKRLHAQVVGSAYCIEISDLNGRDKLDGEVMSLIK